MDRRRLIRHTMTRGDVCVCVCVFIRGKLNKIAFCLFTARKIRNMRVFFFSVEFFPFHYYTFASSRVRTRECRLINNGRDRRRRLDALRGMGRNRGRGRVEAPFSGCDAAIKVWTRERGYGEMSDSNW